VKRGKKEATTGKFGGPSKYRVSGGANFACKNGKKKKKEGIGWNRGIRETAKCNKVK